MLFCIAIISLIRFQPNLYDPFYGVFVLVFMNEAIDHFNPKDQSIIIDAYRSFF